MKFRRISPSKHVTGLEVSNGQRELPTPLHFCLLPHLLLEGSTILNLYRDLEGQSIKWSDGLQIPPTGDTLAWKQRNWVENLFLTQEIICKEVVIMVIWRIGLVKGTFCFPLSYWKKQWEFSPGMVVSLGGNSKLFLKVLLNLCEKNNCCSPQLLFKQWHNDSGTASESAGNKCYGSETSHWDFDFGENAVGLHIFTEQSMTLSEKQVWWEF